jgi:hypothetical protein
MSAAVESARSQWLEGDRRLAGIARSDRAAYARLLGQIEVVTEEIRKRIGQVFTLAELAALYGTSERWVREALDERGVRVRPGDEAVAQDAAFHLAARAALDYEP